MEKKLVKLSDFYIHIGSLIVLSSFVFYFDRIIGIISYIATIGITVSILFYVKNKNEEFFEEIKRHRDSLNNIAFS